MTNKEKNKERKISAKWYHDEVFTKFPKINPKKDRKWKFYDHLLAFAVFGNSVRDLVLDIILAKEYTVGRVCIQNATNTTSGYQEDQCDEEKEPYYAYLTLMSIFLPAPHIITLIFEKRVASVLNIVWGFIFAVVGGLIIGLYKSESFFGFYHFDLLYILTPLGLYCMICGFGTIAIIAFKSKEITYKNLLFGWKSLLYPLVFLLSPLVCLLVSFRAIFRHNDIFRQELIEFKFIESFMETSTQLCIQKFILLKGFGIYNPSTAQYCQ